MTRHPISPQDREWLATITDPEALPAKDRGRLRALRYCAPDAVEELLGGSAPPGGRTDAYERGAARARSYERPAPTYRIPDPTAD